MDLADSRQAGLLLLRHAKELWRRQLRPGSTRDRHPRDLVGVDPRFEDQDLTGAEFRECDLSRARLIGVVMQDAVIDGLVSNLVVNGVEVTSYVEAQLDRRHPVRLLIRSADPAGLRQALRQLRTDWAATAGRLRGMPRGSEHQRIGGEWSAVETLRHLVFVHDSWFRRCCLGSAEPFTAIGLASAFVPDQEEQGLDRAAPPGLDEVLAVRDAQGAELELWLSAVTADQLSAPAPVPAGRGWPPYATGKSVLERVHLVLDEEWAHHGFCLRAAGGGEAVEGGEVKGGEANRPGAARSRGCLARMARWSGTTTVPALRLCQVSR
jgi:hypothetical protein